MVDQSMKRILITAFAIALSVGQAIAQDIDVKVDGDGPISIASNSGIHIE